DLAYPAGMHDVRGMVIRPLLDIGRDALREYLASIGQSWREDPTNRDATRTRAWLRAEVMPLLTKRYPAAGARLARTARSIGEARFLIDELARSRFGAGAIRVSALARAPRAVQRSGVGGLLRTAAV